MNKNIWLAILAIAIIGSAAYLFLNKQDAKVFDPLNATYIFEGQPKVTFVNGQEDVELAPGSADRMITKVFGEPVNGDLNGDGRLDAALFITQTAGGTGTFYYVAAAINTKNGAEGTNTIFLGDRIAPQGLEIRDGMVVANYADRKPGEPMAAMPSVGLNKYLIYESSELKEGGPKAQLN